MDGPKNPESPFPDKQISQILHTVFGYSAFRGDQAAIINQVLSGGDALVLMPTGGGKSLCYQIPALLRRGTGIVISPLLPQVQDQVRGLCQQGIKAAYLHADLPVKKHTAVKQQLSQGDLDILYVTPEQLLETCFLEQLSQIPLALFAIDEAHCVSQWGHDFRPEYAQLSMLNTHFPGVPRIALTATADETTRREIVTRLNLYEARWFIESFDRPNICYRIEHKHDVRAQLLNFLATQHPNESGMVYCLSNQRADRTAQWLMQHGFKALAYHSGMDARTREETQLRFLNESGILLVTNISSGLPISNPHVRFVAHLDLPKSLENYYQETGYAGRDDLPAEAWMVYGLGDIVTLRQGVDHSQADELHKRIERGKLNALLGYCETTLCRRQALLAYFGENYGTPCGCCDNCLNPPTLWDGTLAAQMALSCIYHTGQRFGVRHLVDVLEGKSTVRVRRFGHDHLRTFGIGGAYDTAQWHSIYRQLIASGWVTVDMETYGGLRLNEVSRAILCGERRVCLRLETRAQGRRATSALFAASPIESPEDSALWQALKDERLRLAREQGVPPYLIFHDSTLREMLWRRPRDLEQLAEISGVGKQKLQRYGNRFLEIINHQPQAQNELANNHP